MTAVIISYNTRRLDISSITLNASELKKVCLSRSRMARRARDSSSGSDTCSSPSERSSDDQGEEELVGVVARDKTLENFYAEQPRVDSRAPTLQLMKSSTDFYFDTVLKEGEMSKEGKKVMTEKYFLDPDTFQRLQPPELKDTKLFMLSRGDHGYKETKMLTIHNR